MNLSAAHLASAFPGLVALGLCSLLLFMVALIIAHFKAPRLRLPLYIGLAALVGCITLLMGTTALWQLKGSPGPTERHTPIAFWACGRQLDLRDPPKGVANKIGSPIMHEHNDNVIHYQGVPADDSELTLGAFMQAVGGEISPYALVVPLNESWSLVNKATDATIDKFLVMQRDGSYGSFVNGQTCDNQAAEVQLFVRPTGSVEAQKVSNPSQFALSASSRPNTADCLIVEFDTPKTTTSHSCTGGTP